MTAALLLIPPIAPVLIVTEVPPLSSLLTPHRITLFALASTFGGIALQF